LNKNLKSLFTAGVFTGALLVGTSAYANEDTTTIPESTEVTSTTGTTESADTTSTTDTTATTEQVIELPVEEPSVTPGVTPDSFFYFFDQMSENIQLLLTTDAQKESEFLLQFAQERLSESSQMAEDSKDQYITGLIDSYLATLQEAQEKVSEVVIDETTDQQVKEDLTTQLENATTVDPAVEKVLEEQQLANLTEKKQEAFLVANIVKDLDVEKVKALRAEGLGFGQIVKVITLAEESGKTEAEIVALLKDESKGFGEIAKELNVEPSAIVKKVINKKEDLIEEAFEKALESGDQAAIEQLTKAMETIKKQKIEYEIVKEYAELEEEVAEKLTKIQEKLAAGEITQEEADQKIEKLKKKAEKELAELQEEADEEVNELEEEMREELEEEREDKDEEEHKDDEDLEEEHEKKAEVVKKKQEEQAKKERERQKELAEKQKKEEKEALEKERKRQKELEEKKKQEKEAIKKAEEERKKQEEQKDQHEDEEDEEEQDEDEE
jgi:hypothetical protein